MWAEGRWAALALLTALRLGVREVLVQDVSDVRLNVARRMGATQAANVATEEGRAEARSFARTDSTWCSTPPVQGRRDSRHLISAVRAAWWYCSE